MKKSIFFYLVIFLVLVMISCGDKKVEQAAGTGVEAEPGISPPRVSEKVVAEVTGDSLRVRVSPYLDAEIIGHLMSGNRVLVESKTRWSEIISDMEDPWFFVRADGYSGWTYGGFLDFGGASSDSVPVDPAFPPPEDKSSPAVSSTGVLDPSSLPEILLPVFGQENPLLADHLKDGVISYNAVHEKLIIPLPDSPDSEISLFAAGDGGGASSLLIVAESHKAVHYERRYRAEDCEYLSDAILVDFFPLATLDSGSWEIYALVGDNNWPAAVGKINITPAEITLSNSPEPDPLRDNPRGHYSTGDTVYAFGRLSTRGGRIQLALYHESDEYSEGKLILNPIRAVELQSDDTGFWSTTFLLDESMPQGRYWAALGNPIDGIKSIRLFITGIYYGNIS